MTSFRRIQNNYLNTTQLKFNYNGIITDNHDTTGDTAHTLSKYHPANTIC